MGETDARDAMETGWDTLRPVGEGSLWGRVAEDTYHRPDMTSTMEPLEARFQASLLSLGFGSSGWHGV